MIDEREVTFRARVERGDLIEAGEWLPDDYRLGVLKFLEMHANSEIMGALPEREWIPRAPTLRRKMSLTAKVQDEVGHAQLIYSVAQDLGKSRETMIEDLIAGKTKFHNVFHYPTETWADVALIGWLIDGAALVTQHALLKSNYAPYVRILKRICAEESLHLKHGEDITLELAGGTPAQRAMFQDALNRWWEPIMHFFGPSYAPANDALLMWRFKTRANEDLRQEFLSRYVPRIWSLGFTLPDPALRKDEASGRWLYTEPDWSVLKAVVTGHGPATGRRLALRRASYAEHGWVRAALQAHAAQVEVA
ncbi:MAG TPA: 1,2-phenylacetyl-CoA epoxidase subunit PaaA [Chloroflexota bacterium]|nr:1,2-phenylacetyl-CoA epoxidase subunit PaaA [Chloroflexota bacterium]